MLFSVRLIEENVVQDINLYHLLRFYAKKWMWIVGSILIALALGHVYNTYIQTPLYKSSATLILINPNDKRTTQDVTLINNYIELFKSRRVLEPVISEKKVDIDYDTLVDSIDATNEKNTDVIKVSISTPSPDTSKTLVEGSVASFKEQAEKLYKLDNVRSVDEASYSSTPYNVHKSFILLVTGIGGLIISLLALFFAYDYSLTHYKTLKKSKSSLRRAKMVAIIKTMSELFHIRKAEAPLPAKKTVSKKTSTKTKSKVASATAKTKKTPVKKVSRPPRKTK